MGNHMWGRWVNPHGIVQLDVYTEEEKIRQAVWELYVCSGTWASPNWANGQMPITMHNASLNNSIELQMEEIHLAVSKICVP